MLFTRRDDPWEPYHPERVLLRAALWSAVILFAICLAINVVSLFGYDLTQLVHSRWSNMEGSDPEVAFVGPISGAFVVLLIPIFFHQGWWRERFQEDFQAAPLWMKRGAGASWLYVVTMMIYMSIAFHGGGPQIHNGTETIWLKGDGRYEQVSPEAYHRAVAVMMLFVSAWGMAAFAGIALFYRGWLQNVMAPAGWSPAAGDK